MAFTVNDFEDLIRILESQPDWRARLRSLVLTDEVLALPDLIHQLIATQERTEERLGRLEEVITQLAEAQRATEARLAELASRLTDFAVDMDRFRGFDVENRYRLHATAYLGEIVRRTYVLSDNEVAELLDSEEARGLL
jgi:hypothetical protein